MGRKADQLAGDIVAAVAAHHGISKAAGGVGALYSAVRPLCDLLIEQDRHIRRTSKAIRKNARQLRRMNAPAPGPWAPPHRGMVPMKPQEWKAVLQPAAEPQRNGYHVAGPDDDDGPDSGPWDDLRN